MIPYFMWNAFRLCIQPETVSYQRRMISSIIRAAMRRKPCPSSELIIRGWYQAGLVGQGLQLAFPQSPPPPIGAAAVGRDHQPGRGGIAGTAHLVEPAADRIARELGGVAGDPDADPAAVVGQIVDPVRHHLAKLLVLEVVDVGSPRLACGTVVGSLVTVVADQLLLLRVP